MEKNAKIYIAGHRGLVGSAIWKNLQDKGYTNLIGRTHKELDLLDGMAVRKFFDEEQPEYVFLAAAFVGGIMANSIYRADFIYKNLQIQQNIIGESFRHNVKKLLFLGSTCIYPRDAEQPMKEDVLLTSPLEYTNEPYAIAKIAGLKMCESFNLQYGTNYIAVMPTNLYGPNDNFDLERSHVLPAMIRKIYLAKCLNEGDWDAVRKDINLRPVKGVNGSYSNEEILAELANFGITPEAVTLWGTGKPLREFLWSEEMADASVHVLLNVDFKDTNLLEMCNSHEYATMMLEANPEAYRSIFEKSVAEFGGNMENLQFNADTNWYDELLRTAMMTNHSLNISGGTEKATYSAGMSYLAQDGIMDVENYYRRLNFRAALDYEARKWLKVGFNGVFSNSQQQLPKNAAWQQAYNTPSIIPVYDDRRDDAVFPKKYTSPEQVGLTNNFNNPVATANYYDNRNETYQVLTNFYAQLNLIPDKLNIRSSYSYDYSMIRGSEFTPTYYVGTNQKKEVTELTKKNTNYYKYIWDNVATYTDKWGKHSFTGMLGASMRQEQYRLLEGTATNVPEGEDVWKYIALGNKEGATVKDDGWKYRGLSYFTRLNYNYNDKYMLMFTFRADGSSKYNDKWGYFPSIGAAWVISQEPFMKNQNIFDYMKLRASWGKLGNDKIAASAGFASIQNVQSVFGPNTAIDGFINTTNFSWLGWEVVNETNVGVNFSTLKNRLNADIDWYYRLTDNAVISPKLPMSGELLAGNNGQILNTGIDLSLNWNDKIGQDFNEDKNSFYPTPLTELNANDALK